jgi:hypothetical protein
MQHCSEASLDSLLPIDKRGKVAVSEQTLWLLDGCMHACVQMAQRFGLREAAAGVCRSVGAAHASAGRAALALQWLGRCGDERALSEAARPLVASVARHAASPSGAGAPTRGEICTACTACSQSSATES